MYFLKPGKRSATRGLLQIQWYLLFTDVGPRFCRLFCACHSLHKVKYQIPDPRECMQMHYTGEGVQFGLKVAWSLLIRPDGAFVEECRSQHLKTITGHDGSPHSQCWEASSNSCTELTSLPNIWYHSELAVVNQRRQVDGMGLPKSLELDDHEVRFFATISAVVAHLK